MTWRFQDFELDEVRFELRRGDKRVSIAPKPLALLLHLAKRYPASVSREELFRVLWPGAQVTDASLARAVLAARNVIEGEGGDGGVIRTIRGRGYAFGDTFVADPSPLPAAHSLEAPFVGRAAELARIEAAFDNVEVGRGRLLFVSGEPGIGKSRLLDELAARAHRRRAVIVSGHCRADEGAPPYWPWSEIFHGLMSACDDPHLRSTVEPLLADLTRHRAPPSYADPARGVPVVTRERFRLFQAVTDALRQAARQRLLTVLIEDLQWAGPGALHLLRFAGRSLANASVLIAMTYRSAGRAPRPVVEAAMGELTALPHAVPVLRLAAFSGDEIAAYVRNVIGKLPDAGQVRRLQEVAGGNPLFLRELVPIFAAQDVVGESREHTPVPASINHLVRAQIARLSKPALALVEIASVNGGKFAPQLLAQVSGRRVETVLEHLGEARAENLIEPDGAGHFRFRHGIIRAAVFEALRPARRIELHWRVARALEAGAETQARLADLAHHFFEALPRVDSEKAVLYATRAAEAARRALDFAAAVRHYRQALAALEQDESATTAERCDLLLGLGEVLELTGQRTQSREVIIEAAQLARALRSFPRLGRAALGMTAGQQLDVADPVAVQLVEDSLRAVGRRPLALRARLLAKLAVLRRVEGHESAASRLVKEALALGKRLGDLPLECDVSVQQLLVMQLGVSGNHATRLVLTSELLKVAERARNTYALLQCRRQRIALLLGAGAGAQLDEEIELFAGESAAAGCKEHYVVAFRAMRALVSGRFEEARRAIDETERRADPRSPEERRFVLAGQRLQLPPEYRDNEGLARSIQDIIRDYPQVAAWRSAYALVALDLGQTEVARAALQDAGSHDFTLVPRNMSFVATIGALVRISWRLGERRYARRLHELLLPHAGAQVSSGMGMVYGGPVDWHLGALAVMLGRRHEAARRFKVGLATTERLGAWPWHARIELNYAELLARGSTADQRRAHALAVRAAGAARRLGIRNLRREAQHLAAKLRRRGGRR